MEDRRPRVLVVDDERHIVDFLAMGLKGRGMEVEESLDAEGAVLAATPDAGEISELNPSVQYPRVERTGGYLATTFASEEVSGANGEVYVTLSRISPVLRGLLATEIIGVAVALALVAGLGPTLAARALRPLKRVSIVAGELRRGELGCRVNLPELKNRRDQVGEVATSFDEMAVTWRGFSRPSTSPKRACAVSWPTRPTSYARR